MTIWDIKVRTNNVQIACKNILNALTVYCLVDLNAAAVMKIGSKTKRNVKRNIESNAAMAKIRDTIKKHARTTQPIKSICMFGNVNKGKSSILWLVPAAQANEEPIPDGIADVIYRLHNIQSMLSFIAGDIGVTALEAVDKDDDEVPSAKRSHESQEAQKAFPPFSFFSSACNEASGLLKACSFSFCVRAAPNENKGVKNKSIVLLYGK